MFDPLKATRDKAQKAQKKKTTEDLKSWAREFIPEDLREGLIIDVSEVVCGDPSCAPVDTFFTLVWETSGKGVFAIPAEMAEISKDELKENFPVRAHIKDSSYWFANCFCKTRIEKFWSNGRLVRERDGLDCLLSASKLVTAWNVELVLTLLKVI